MEGGAPSKVNEFSLLQLIKAYGPICVTPAGIVIDVRLLQLMNASALIVVNVEGKETLVACDMLLKVNAPIVVTPSSTTIVITSLWIPTLSNGVVVKALELDEARR